MTHKVQRLYDRLKAIGIDTEFRCNWPWVYLHAVNGICVGKVSGSSNHGFHVYWDSTDKFVDLRTMFKEIRSMVEVSNE